MSSYYGQFEKEDTDSWQGKDYVAEKEIDEVMEEEPISEECDHDYRDDFRWSDFL